MLALWSKSCCRRSNLKCHLKSAKLYSIKVPHLEEWKTLKSPFINSALSIPTVYGSLSKFKLSALVVSTTFAGFLMGPLPFSLSITSLFSSNCLQTLCFTLLGTAMCSFSANTFNQWIEAPLDSQMNRTRCRVLPIHRISLFHAFNYAVLMGIGGISLLAIKISWLAGLMAATNIALYAVIYTPMKRISIGNTWIGAIVGSIPPMIGWAGAASLSTGSPLLLFFPDSLILASVLYCWQFPHFNSLSWSLRGDYSRAGYCMASVLEPQTNLNVALRHSLALIGITFAIPYYFNLATPMFAWDANILNLIMAYLAWNFRASPNRKTSRQLFFWSLIHLPLYVILLICHKENKLLIDENPKK